MVNRLRLPRFGRAKDEPPKPPVDGEAKDSAARVASERQLAAEVRDLRARLAKATAPRVRPPNEGVDRAQVIGRALRWMSSWSLRMLLILIALWMTLKIIGLFWSALLPVFIALVIATVLWPPTRWLRNHGFRPAAAAATTMLGSVAIVAAIVAAMAPSVTDQWPDLTARSIDGVKKIQTWLQGPPFNVAPDQIDNAVKAVTEKLQASGDKIASGVFSGVSVASGILVTLVVSIILCFFMIKDGPLFLPWLRTVAGRGAGAHFTELLSRVWLTLSGFIRTQALVSAVDSFFIGLGLVFLGVPLALPLAVLTFFGGFIPIVGATVAGALAVLVALVTKGVTTALLVLLIVILVQQLEGHILQPLLQSRSMSMHPALILLAISLGGHEFGIVGAFFAVPVAATIIVVMRYLGEHIDLRTGDLKVDDLELLTPEGRYASEQAVKDIHPPTKPDLADKITDL